MRNLKIQGEEPVSRMSYRDQRYVLHLLSRLSCRNQTARHISTRNSSPKTTTLPSTTFGHCPASRLLSSLIPPSRSSKLPVNHQIIRESSSANFPADEEEHPFSDRWGSSGRNREDSMRIRRPSRYSRSISEEDLDLDDDEYGGGGSTWT